MKESVISYQAALHGQELDRVNALHKSGLLTRKPSDRLNKIIQDAAGVFHVPIVLVVLVGADRQFFLARHGSELTETHRDMSFCSHAILEDEILVVEDTRTHDVYKHNPLVSSGLNIGFYAGAVIRDEKHLPLGTLCIIDSSPRQFSVSDEHMLIYFSKLVKEEILAGRPKIRRRKRKEGLTVGADPLLSKAMAVLP